MLDIIFDYQKFNEILHARNLTVSVTCSIELGSCFEDASEESREAAARTTRLVNIYFPKLLLFLSSLAYSILF